MPYRSTELTRTSAEARRAGFLRSARSLVSTHGFAGATVSAIADESGTSVGLVYSYFDDRENLLAEVFRSAANHELDAVRQAVAAAGTDPIAQIAALIDTFARRALRGRQMAWSLLFEPVIPGVDRERLVFRRAYRELCEDIIRAGVVADVFVAPNLEVCAAAMMGAISEALVGALHPLAETTSTSADVVTNIRHFCFRALNATAKDVRR